MRVAGVARLGLWLLLGACGGSVDPRPPEPTPTTLKRQMQERQRERERRELYDPASPDPFDRPAPGNRR